MEVGEEFQGMKLAGKLLHYHTWLDPRKLDGVGPVDNRAGMYDITRIVNDIVRYRPF